MTQTNATITVAYGTQAIVIELDGPELSEIQLGNGMTNRYLNNASRSHIASVVETALLALVKDIPTLYPNQEVTV